MTRGASAAALELDGVAMRFGAVVALDRVSFSVRRGEICGLIGPNGSGKTTLFNCISGFCRPESGNILFDGVPITALARYRISALGIGRTFQNLALFHSMTVRDNIAVGAHQRGRSGLLAAAFGLPRSRREEAATQAQLDEMIDLLDLRPFADKPVSTLSFGTAKRVELARALMGRPRLLLLDEPACGLNHEEVEALREQILRIRAQYGLSVLLVEHHMGLVMRLCEHVVVLASGRKIADGSAPEVQRNSEVVRAYLGAFPSDARAA